MKRTIWAKLSIIFIGFLLLVSGSVVATFWAIDHQSSDTLNISLATRQRAYVHSMARSVLDLQTDGQKDAYYLVLIELDQASEKFRETQELLLLNSHPTNTSFLPRLTSPNVVTQLERVQMLWAPMDEAAISLLNGAKGTIRSRAITEIEQSTPKILAEIDLLVQYMEASASQNLKILKTIQLIFFLCAAALLVVSYFLIKGTILNPLKSLDAAAREIASGNLSQTISLGQSDEIGLLAHTFEIMRQEVAASRYSAEAWTDQLEARVQQRTKEMAALLEISTDISSNLDVDSILRSVVDTGRQLLDGQVSVLCLLSEIPQGLSVASFSGPRDALARTTAKVDTGLLADVVSEGKTIACNTCQECPILAQVNAEEMIAAPLRFGDTTIGAICVADLDPSNLTDDSARLLTFLANSAAIALENARLFNRSQTAATLAERERIAAEMHDGLAQTLGYLNLKTGQVLESLDNRSLDDAINHVETMQPAIQQAYSTIRQALVGLSDNSLPQSGFKSQLENCIADFTGKNHAQVDLSVDEACLANIPHQAEQQLIRIAQESLANIRQHSDASKVTINILPDGDFISMTIVDNGCGFDLTAMPTDDQPHIGLKIMRGRIERVGGTLMIQSHPGEGTTISASVPAEYVSQLL